MKLSIKGFLKGTVLKLKLPNIHCKYSAFIYFWPTLKVLAFKLFMDSQKNGLEHVKGPRKNGLFVQVA